MRAMLENIRGDAEARLTLSPGHPPSREVERYRRFLKLETHRLKMRHRAGGSGREVCQARALVLDLLLTQVLRAVELAAPASQLAASPKYALVAIGGYGRGELNPFSDVDIMFLHGGEGLSRSHPPPFMELLTGGLLWDIGLKVGHSVRSLDDCVKVANQDMQSKTSLIEARLICGDQELFAKLQKVVVAKCVKGHENDYLAARLEDQAARRAKYGNSACMQEPHIKNGCGGLRDYQNLLWMAFFKYRNRTLTELEERELITPQERRRLDGAYDFLLRTRNELHYHLNRPVDVLSRSAQPAVAHNLGYTERSPSRRLEKFMRDYYTHSRNLYLITRTLEQRLALLPQPKRLPTLSQFLRQRREMASYVLDGFKFVDGQLHAASSRIFRDQPRRLMRAFRCAQQRGLTLHPDLCQLIRNQLELVDPEFRRDPHVRETFLEILNQRGSVAPTLRAMHEVGLLGRYLPSFGKLTCLVQHEFYHQYTTDEHTLVCLEKLDQLWGAQDPLLAPYAELFQKIERPGVLYLALLLHDAGKASHAPNHADNGSRIALTVAKRLGLDAATARTLCLLIAAHLQMALISQRRDLDDPAVIRSFAAQIETLENLNLLTLLTLADSQGTSDKLWNGFKDTSLWALYHKTRAVLAGSAEFILAESRQRELLADEVRALLPPTFAEDEIQGHFHNLPARYFPLRQARDIVADLTLAHQFMHRQLSDDENPLEPITPWHDEPDRGYSQVRICTWDRHGLFSKIAGALTAAGLNILSAEIFTREDSIVLDTFYVIDARTGELANRAEREQFERILRDALTGELDLDALIRRRKPSKPCYVPIPSERIPTVIRFDNESSDTRTVMDVETEDRVGLLYAVSQVLSELALDISLARICTEKGAAMDTFYLSEARGGKVLERARQRRVEALLRAAIAKLD
jgi:[protein-PII] uridylyltransferase